MNKPIFSITFLRFFLFRVIIEIHFLIIVHCIEIVHIPIEIFHKILHIKFRIFLVFAILAMICIKLSDIDFIVILLKHSISSNYLLIILFYVNISIFIWMIFQRERLESLFDLFLGRFRRKTKHFIRI